GEQALRHSTPGCVPASRSGVVQPRRQALRRDRAVALLHPVAEHLRGRGSLRLQRHPDPAGPAQAVPGGLGAGAGQGVGVRRLVRQLHRHPEGVAAVVHAEEDEHLAVDLGDALPPGVFLGGLRQRLPPGSSSASASHTLASATDSGAAARPRGVMSRLDRTDRPYDIVLFGATGFVGRLTAEYLAAHAPEGLRWAVAGRSTEKLERLRDGLPGAAGIGVLRADVSEPATLRALAEQSRVVATTVGPYVHHGEELVAACADLGTDYLDLTGEPEFVDLMYVRYDTRARETGARLVHACGFDS